MPRVWIATIVVMIAAGCTPASNSGDAPAAPDSAQKATTSNAHAGPKAETACEVLTANDIAGILKVAQVTKHEPYSGKNEFTKVDFCYWYAGKFNPNRDESIQVKLYRAESADEGALLALFSAAKSDLVSSGLVGAQPISGVGDEAIYTPFPDGGAIAMRAGTSAVSISGLLSKDALVSMAKVAAHKL